METPTSLNDTPWTPGGFDRLSENLILTTRLGRCMSSSHSYCNHCVQLLVRRNQATGGGLVTPRDYDQTHTTICNTQSPHTCGACRLLLRTNVAPKTGRPVNWQKWLCSAGTPHTQHKTPGSERKEAKHTQPQNRYKFESRHGSISAQRSVAPQHGCRVVDCVAVLWLLILQKAGACSSGNPPPIRSLASSPLLFFSYLTFRGPSRFQ